MTASPPRALPGNQGSIYAAIVPFAAEPPFRVIQPDASERSYEGAEDLFRAIKSAREPVEFTIPTRAKIRPVLLLQDRPLGRFPEFAALQISSLRNLGALAERVRKQQEPALFHLDASRGRYGLRNDSFIDLQSLVRVRKEALVGRKLGTVDANEFRTICERLVLVCDLDLKNLIVREAADLIKRLRGP